MFKKRKPPIDQPTLNQHPRHHNEIQHSNIRFSSFLQFPDKAFSMQVIQKTGNANESKNE
jgi:hypothetical protein